MSKYEIFPVLRLARPFSNFCSIYQIHCEYCYNINCSTLQTASELCSINVMMAMPTSKFHIHTHTLGKNCSVPMRVFLLYPKYNEKQNLLLPTFSVMQFTVRDKQMHQTQNEISRPLRSELSLGEMAWQLFSISTQRVHFGSLGQFTDLYHWANSDILTCVSYTCID